MLWSSDHIGFKLGNLLKHSATKWCYLICIALYASIDCHSVDIISDGIVYFILLLFHLLLSYNFSGNSWVYYLPLAQWMIHFIATSLMHEIYDYFLTFCICMTTFRYSFMWFIAWHSWSHNKTVSFVCKWWLPVPPGLVCLTGLDFWWIQVRVQSDPAGRLVITGEPEQVDNPWGITPFKKV